jgi:uncharacterized membrane protein YccF (DUF307 family)
MNIKSIKLKNNNLLFALLFIMTAFTSSLKAQLIGTKNIPGDYASLALAITDLNTQGVGAGGVTINVIAGNPETAPAGGYSITANGTLADQITIQGNANIITASASLTAGALNDAIFKIIGGDYITISGFDMQENAANTTTTAASNNMTEFGVALFYATATNGAQNITIQTNTITLNRIYQNTFGIYANSMHNATAIATTASATGANGGSHNLKIYSNTISNVNIGMTVVGPSAAADHNQGIDIGGASLATGNTISNYGTTSTFSGYSNVSGTINGILIKNGGNYNISYNSIASSNGGNTAGTLYGIQIATYSTAPTIAYNQIINYNTISLRSGFITGAINGISVLTTAVASTSSLSISNNDFNTFGHTVAGTAAINFINTVQQAGIVNINNNTFSNIAVNTTGSVTFISNNVTRPANAICEVSNNSIVGSFNKNGAGGTLTFYNSNGATTNSARETNYNNNFSNINVIGATTIAGWISTDGPTTSPFGPSKTISNNIFNNINGGTSAVTILNAAYGNFSGPGNSVSNNTITNISSGGAITGIISGGGSQDIFSNSINSFTTTGANSISGITISGGSVQNIFKNKIYAISGSNASSTVNGILVSGGTTNTIYNNIIGDLTAPIANGANTINGINITGGTTDNVYYNSVYLNASSSGTDFGSSAIFTNATPTTINLNNNIFINNSTPNGTALAVAFRRSAAALTNYGTSSNNNLFYASTPSPSTAIFFDGTTAQQSLGDFKSFVGPVRDAVSLTENPTFASTVGSSPNFLHFNPATMSMAESGGANIATYTDDFAGDIRQGNGGYTGTGTAPDIGADEFEGTPPPNPPTINSVSITPTGVTCTAASRNVSAVVTPGGMALSSVELNYSFNGIPQTPIVMTGGNLSSASTWVATIPVAIPSNANVTWEVTAADASYTVNTAGTSYQDEPTLGVSASASASPTLVCSGSTSTLTLTTSKVAQVTVGNTSGATISTTGTPYRTGSVLNNEIRTQYLILASELSASGLVAGNLNSISLNVITAAPTGVMTNFNIDMAATTATALTTTFLTPSFTNVYSIASYAPVNGANTHIFSTPFNWDGVSNVVINFCGVVGTTGSGTSLVSSTTQSGITALVANSTATGCTDLTGTILGNRRPQLIFTGNQAISANNFSWSNGSIVSTSNPAVVTVTANTTYTVTADISGCPVTATVDVTNQPLPSAPIASDASQCGVNVPTASVSGGTFYNWYATPASTVVLQSGATTNFTSSISSTTSWYISSYDGTCESPRTALTQTVIIPDAVTATSSATNLCVGGANTITLTAVQTGTNNFYTYTWDANPVSGSGIPTSLNGNTVAVTPTVSGSYVYNLTATDGTCTAVSNITVVLNELPSIVASATPTMICSGSNVDLNALTTGVGVGITTVGTGAANSTTYPNPFYSLWSNTHNQYLITAAELSAANISAGNINSLAIDINSGVMTMQDFSIKIGHSAVTNMSAFENNAAFTTVFNAASVTPVVGLNTLNFSTPFNWDGVSNIVIEICHGNSGSSATMSSSAKVDNTSYVSTIHTHKSAASAGAITCGDLTTNLLTYSIRPKFIFSANTMTTVSTGFAWQWNPGAINSNTAVVTPINTGSVASTEIYTATVTNTVTSCSNTTTVGVVVNPVPASPIVTDNTQCGIGVPTASVNGGTSYNWYATPTSTTILQAGANTNFTSSINSTTTWYVSSSNGLCESPRVAVTQTVIAPPVLTIASPTAIVCANTIQTLSVSSTVADYDMYVWTPNTDLYTDASATIPYSGGNASILYYMTNNAGNVSYSVSATNTVSGCANMTSFSITTDKPVITASATPTIVCSGSNVTLDAQSFGIASGTTTVGAQTSTGITGGPYRQGAGTTSANKAQYLFTAAELTAAGLNSGNITEIRFNATSLGSGVMNNYTLRMGATSTPSLGTTYDASPAVVYGPTPYTVVLGQNIHTFSTPFYWDGVSNVIIELCHDAVSPTGTSSNVSLQTMANRTIYSVVAGACGLTTGTSGTNRPVISFGGQVGTNVSSSMNFVWNPGAINSNTAIVTPINTGSVATTQIYTAMVTNTTTNCSNTASVSVLVNPLPVVMAVASNTDICSGSSSTLTASGATNYTWTPSAITVSTAVVTPTTNTTYTVTGSTAGCIATATVDVNVTQTPTVTASANPTVICLGNNAALTAVSSTPNYSWSPAGGTSDVAIVSPSVTTIYTVTSANGVCVSSTTVSLEVLTAPVLTITPLSSTVCSGSSTTLTASGADTYTWSTAGGNAASAVFTPTAMATYTVEGTTACGTGSTTATVNVASPLTLNATTSSTLLCAGEAATLTATGTASSFTWAPGGQTTAVIAVTPTTTSIYTVSSSNICGVVTATVNQNVSPCAGLQELDLSNISIYPNPSTGIVNFDISSELAGNVSLEMYDAIGKLVVKEELTKEHTVLNISKLEEGIYIFKMIRNNGDVKIGRFVKHN